MFAGIAAGLLAAVFATSQILLTESATAQLEEEQGADSNQIADTDQRSTLSTFGRATTTVQPDRFSITIGIETTRDTAQQAASDNAAQASEIVQALSGLGIADEQMSTSQYSLQPVYEEVMPDTEDGEGVEAIPPPSPRPPDQEPRREIAGYRAFNSISVTLDVEGEIEASQVIDTAIEAGATNVSNLSLFVSQQRQQEIRNELIVDAIDDARQRADIAVQEVGMQITGIESINLEEVHFPFPSRGLEAAQTIADEGTPILPGEQEVTSTVHISYFIGGNSSNGGNNEDDNDNEL